MVSEPLFISSQLFPSQLIRIEAFGTFQFLPWTLGYHLHVSKRTARSVRSTSPTRKRSVADST